MHRIICGSSMHFNYFSNVSFVQLCELNASLVLDIVVIIVLEAVIGMAEELCLSFNFEIVSFIAFGFKNVLPV